MNAPIRNVASLTAFTFMKFLEWCESVDHLVVPLSVDVALALFEAGLVTALLRYIMEQAA